MKKEILVAISVAGVLFGLSVSLAAQEKLSLAQCREMALKYNKDMAAANKQTEAARLMSLSYKANFFTEVSEFRVETFRFSCPILLPENWCRVVLLIFPD